MTTSTALAYALAAILATCAAFAFGAYFGFSHARRRFDALLGSMSLWDGTGDDALAMVSDEGSTP